ncbi:MAG TPA: hypothetical protein VGI05_26525 [Streptosporangiaceae bacterium]
MSPIEWMGAASVAVGVAGNCVALVYIRLAQQQLGKAGAIWQELTERLYNAPAALAPGALPLGLPISLKCRIYGNSPHVPCSGTRDDGTGEACECWCHKLRPREPSEPL